MFHKRSRCFADVDETFRAFKHGLLAFGAGLVTHLEHVHEFILRRQQVGAVKSEERRVFLDQFAARKHEELLHVALDARDIIPMPLLVVGNYAHGANGMREWTLFNRRVGNADLLLARDGDREERRSVWSVASVERR